MPYKNFTNFYIDSDWHGYSHYNAMNVKFEHRARDLAATAIYTWAQSKDDKSAAAGVGATGAGYPGLHGQPQPGVGLRTVGLRRGPEVRGQLRVRAAVRPRKERSPGDVNRATNLLIGGWETTGIATFQAGFPFGITASDIQGVLNSQFMRANRISGCDIQANLTEVMQRINFDCFSQPALGVYGNTPRNFLRQPGINNWDMGIVKNFRIAEHVNFKMAGDFFNAWNHHQYAIGTGALIGSGSGGGSSIDNGVGSTTAGQITNASAARVIQISGKLTF